MPERFIVEIENSQNNCVLIVDEVGELPSYLVDGFLTHGYLIYYFGKQNKEFYSYLSGNKRFNFIENLTSIENLRFNYLIYFPKNKFDPSGNVISLAKNTDKTIIALQEGEWDIGVKDLKNYLKENQYICKVIIYPNYFGPRITENYLGQLFLNLINGVSQPDLFDKDLSLAYAKNLSAELIRLIFMSDLRKKIFLIKGNKLKLSELLTRVKKVLPSININVFKSPEDKYLGLVDDEKQFQTIELEGDLDEEVEETINWFTRKYPQKIVEEKAVNSIKEEKNSEIKDESTIVDNINLPVGEIIEKELEVNKQEKLEFLYDKKSAEKDVSETKRTKRPKRLKIGILVFVLLLFVFFTFPLFFFTRYFLSSVNLLINAQKKLNEYSYIQTSLDLDKAGKQVVKAEKIFSLFSPFYSLIGLKSQTGKVESAITFTSHYINAEKYYLAGIKDIALVLESFIKSKDLPLHSEIPGSVKSNFTYAYQEASIAQSIIKDGMSGLALFGSKYKMPEQRLNEIRAELIKAQGFTEIIPKIFSYGGRNSYLMVLQNNFELRPTGGFLSSLVISNIENGKMDNVNVFSVYDVDQNLKGKVEPPEEVKEYLGETNWFLRDANWDGDYPTSAKKILWFIDREKQVKSDGVIAFNLDVVKKILGIVGEITVDDFQDKVNQDNLFEKVIKYSEISNIGQAQSDTTKKDFLTSLIKSLVDKLTTIDANQTIGLWQAVFSSLNTKDILNYFEDQELQSKIAGLNWDGGLRDFQPASSKIGVYTDYLYINEANVGINQANYFIKRIIDQKIEINKEGKVSEKLLLEIENQAITEKWPFGTYKDYLRIYLPKNTNINSVLVNNSGINLWQPVESKKIRIFEEMDKKVIGIYLEIPVKTKTKLELTYDLEKPFVFSQKVTPYLLMIQKQSGTGILDYNLTFKPEKGAVALRVIPKAIVGEESLLVSEKLSSDKVIQIDLAK